MPSVSICGFIFIKTTSPHEGNLKTERIRNFEKLKLNYKNAIFLYALLAPSCACMCAPRQRKFAIIFSEIMNQIMQQKCELKYPNLLPFTEIETFHSFLFRVFLHNRFYASYSTAGCLVYNNRNMRKNFQPRFWQNLYRACRLCRL